MDESGQFQDVWNMTWQSWRDLLLCAVAGVALLSLLALVLFAAAQIILRRK